MKKIVEKVKKLSVAEKILIVLLIISLVMVIFSHERIVNGLKKSIKFYSAYIVTKEI